MDIQEVRIDAFAKWERVRVPLLSSRLQVIYFKDGGRTQHFVQFIQRLWFGDATTPSISKGAAKPTRSPCFGSLLLSGDSSEWSIQRRSDGDGGWRLLRDGNRLQDPAQSIQRVRAGLTSEEAAHVLVTPPRDTSWKCWEWLQSRPAWTAWLVPDRRDAALDNLPNISAQHVAEVLRDLARDHDLLLTSIPMLRNAAKVEWESRRARELNDPPVPPVEAPPVAPIVPPAPTPLPSAHARRDMENDLRMLQMEMEPWKLASQLADPWQQIQLLSQRLTHQSADITALRTWWEEYQQLASERKETLQKIRGLRHRPTRVAGKPVRDRDSELQRLLSQRDNVLRAAELRNRQFSSLPVAPADSSRLRGLPDELRHLADELADARHQLDSLERAPVEAGNAATTPSPPLLNGPFDGRLAGPSELDAFDPLGVETVERCLSELRRRRLWIKEEHKCVLGRQRITGSMALALTLQFCLGLASLFGLLLTRSPAAQWALLAIGLGALVATGAIKMGVERRNRRLLRRVTARLSRIELEIESLVGADMEAAVGSSTPRVSAQAQFHASRRLVECRARVTSLEAAYRQLLAVYRLPVSLSPEQVVTVARERERRSHKVRPETATEVASQRKLLTWIDRAKKLLHSLGQDDLDADVYELLRRLDGLRSTTREDSTRDGSRAAKSPQVEALQELKQTLQRLDRRQQRILREAGVADGFALESAVEKEESNIRNRQQLQTIKREVSQALDAGTCGDTARDLLENYGAEELRSRLQRMVTQQQELAEALSHQTSRVESSFQLSAAPVPSERETQDVVEPFPATLAPRSKVESGPKQRQLDRARLQLAMIEARLRNLLRLVQQAAIVQRIGQTCRTLVAPQRSQADYYLHTLTNGVWTGFATDAERTLALRRHPDQTVSLADVPNAVSQAAWLAWQLAAAHQLRLAGRKVPLLLLADEIELLRSASPACITTLQAVAETGQQIVVLTDQESTAKRLSTTAVPILHVGLEQVDEKLHHRDSTTVRGTSRADVSISEHSVPGRLAVTSL